MIDETTYREHFTRFEGRYKHFYLDGEGIVTIGIGCQVFDCSTLLMLRKTTSTRTERADIFSDYNAVKALPAGKVASYYDRVCLLYLPEVEINSLFKSRLDSFLRSIADSIASLDAFPDPAALVLVDMAFNLGTAGLSRKFPKFMNAFMAKDWKRAALECRREGVQEERNEWARTTLESLVEV